MGEQANRTKEMDSYLEFARRNGLNADDRRTAEAFEAYCAKNRRPLEPGFSGSWHSPQHKSE